MWNALLRSLTLTEAWIGGLGLAAFLLLFWVLRGAPPGQAVEPEGDDAPRGGYRDRVIAAVCVGMLLIVLGAYLVVTRGVAWSVAPFALGFGTVVLLVLINRRHRHGSPTMRRTLDLSTAALNASLVAGVLIVVNVLAFRHGGRAIDMTREGAYSLSTRSLNLTRSLTRPVTFTTFYGRGAAAYLQYDRVRQLLELYQAANPAMVRLAHVDPFRDPTRFEELAKRAPAVQVTQGGGVVVDFGEGQAPQSLVVRNADLFELPGAARFDPSIDRFESRFKGEDAITSALMRLREGKRVLVAFTTGHGEPSLGDHDTNRPGLGLLAARLASTGVETVAVNLLTEDLPSETALVVVAGPRTAFQPDEVARLRQFAERKKPVLILLGDTEDTGLGAFLHAFGVEAGKGLVVEPRQNLRGQVEVVAVPVVDPRHPIVEPLANQFLVFPRTAPLRVATPTSAESFGDVSVLLKSSPESWLEADLAATRVEDDGKKPRGPFDLALAVADRRQQGAGAGAPAHRLVVIASRYLADNRYVQTAPANLDLLMNAVAWLRSDPGGLGIDPKTHTALTLSADPVLRARLILVPSVMAVLLIIVVGLTTYAARRD